ncbi:MAG: hypothetical protein ABH803_00565 [Candidatus Micrarchaeota archaeon]
MKLTPLLLLVLLVSFTSAYFSDACAYAPNCGGSTGKLCIVNAPITQCQVGNQVFDSVAKQAICSGAGYSDCCVNVQITTALPHLSSPTSRPACLEAKGTPTVHLRNIKVTCSASGSVTVSSIKSNGFLFTDVDNVEINGCTLKGNNAYSDYPEMHVSGTSGVWGAAVQIGASATSGKVDGIRIVNVNVRDQVSSTTNTPVNVTGISIVKAKNIYISGGSIRNIYSGKNIHGIRLGDTENFRISYVVFNKLFGNTNLLGIYVDRGITGSNQVDHLTISELRTGHANINAIDFDLGTGSSASVSLEDNVLQDLAYSTSAQVSGSFLSGDLKVFCDVATGGPFNICRKKDGEARVCSDGHSPFVEMPCFVYGIGIRGAVANSDVDFYFDHNTLNYIYGIGSLTSGGDAAIGIAGGGDFSNNEITDVGALRGSANGFYASGSFSNNVVKDVVSLKDSGATSSAIGIRLKRCGWVDNNLIEGVYSQGISNGLSVNPQNAGNCVLSDNTISKVMADGTGSLAVGAGFNNLNGEISDLSVTDVSGETAVGIAVEKDVSGSTSTSFSGGISVKNILASSSYSYYAYDHNGEPNYLMVIFNPRTYFGYGVTLGYETPVQSKAQQVSFTGTNALKIDGVNCFSSAGTGNKAVGLRIFNSDFNEIDGATRNDVEIKNINCYRSGGVGAIGVEVRGKSNTEGSDGNEFSGFIHTVSSSADVRGVFLTNARNNDFKDFAISLGNQDASTRAISFGSGAGSDPGHSNNMLYSMALHYYGTTPIYGYDNIFRSVGGSLSTISVSGNAKNFFIDGNSFNTILNVNLNHTLGVTYGTSANTGSPPNHRLSVKQYADFEIHEYVDLANPIGSLITSGVLFGVYPNPTNSIWAENVIKNVSNSPYNNPYLRYTAGDLGNKEVDVYWLAKTSPGKIEFSPHEIETITVPSGGYLHLPVQNPNCPTYWPDTNCGDSSYFVDSPTSNVLSTRFSDVPNVYLNRLTGDVNKIVFLLYKPGALPACDGLAYDPGEECGDPGTPGCSSDKKCVNCLCYPKLVCGDGIITNPNDDLQPEFCDGNADLSGCTDGTPVGCKSDCTCDYGTVTPPIPLEQLFSVSLDTPEFSNLEQTSFLMKLIETRGGMGVCINENTPVSQSAFFALTIFSVKYDLDAYLDPVEIAFKEKIDSLDCDEVDDLVSLLSPSTSIHRFECFTGGLYPELPDPRVKEICVFTGEHTRNTCSDPCSPSSLVNCRLCLDSCSFGEHVYGLSSVEEGGYKVLTCINDGVIKVDEAVADFKVDFKRVQTPSLHPLLIVLVGLGALFVLQSRKPLAK